MKYYIKDSTINREVQFNTYTEVVKHLEGTCQRKFGKLRRTYMSEMEGLGYSPDDNEATQFVRLLSEVVEVGVLREHGKMRTDITNIDRYNKPEFGDALVSPKY